MQRVAVVDGDGIGPELGSRIGFLLVGGCALAGMGAIGAFSGAFPVWLIGVLSEGAGFRIPFLLVGGFALAGMGAIGAFSGAFLVWLIGVLSEGAGFRIPLLLVGGFALAGVLPMLLVIGDLEMEEPAK